MPFVAALAFVCASPLAVDGDTLWCRGIGRVRLLAIDAPELAGHCRQGRRCVVGDGRASKAHLGALLRRGAVRCQGTGADAYGRVLASCRAGGVDLSCAQVGDGFAIQRYGRLRCD